MPRPSPKRPHHALLSSRSGMELKGTAQAGWMPPTPIESNIYTPSKNQWISTFSPRFRPVKDRNICSGAQKPVRQLFGGGVRRDWENRYRYRCLNASVTHSFMRIAQHLPHTHTAHDHDHSPKSITYNSCGHTYVCINENTNSATQGKNRLKLRSTEHTYSYS